MTPSDLAANLERTTRPIKNALMDQSVIAGLGNIYVDESLHAANLHPLTPANKLTPAQIKILTLQIKSILKRAIKSRGTTLRDYVDGTGRLGTAQSLLQVYARENHPCPTCQTPIQRIVLGGRSTHFCPHCQPR
jgi:formamidopyrimidine-DNA glycosylase